MVITGMAGLLLLGSAALLGSIGRDSTAEHRDAEAPTSTG